MKTRFSLKLWHWHFDHTSHLASFLFHQYLLYKNGCFSSLQLCAPLDLSLQLIPGRSAEALCTCIRDGCISLFYSVLIFKFSWIWKQGNIVFQSPSHNLTRLDIVEVIKGVFCSDDILEAGKWLPFPFLSFQFNLRKDGIFFSLKRWVTGIKVVSGFLKFFK